ncbi:Chemotaxis protein CheY [BD1-7 clade bacterium]|uniref:Chemotaxis protein CheY n=1 Tax=BD1-7 clade bacterium TaxID=2029982 RepID=A0A5S9PQT3_9GAMM|nr:Chemotaxis protein CheY [BD1-7 clade bacterium]
MSSNTMKDLKLLLVVPSRLQQTLLSKSLTRFGVEDIAICRTIEEAIVRMREAGPSLVVSSMYFEDGDGLDLVEAMRQDTQLASIDFMLVSAEHRFSVLDPMRQAGVLAVLPKPFAEDDLYRALNSSATLAALKANVPQAENEPAFHASSLRILLVDDSLLARKQMLRVLTRLGVSEALVRQAEDGQEALKVLEEATFDIIFTDYNMPNMDGEALLLQIRQKQDMADIPVFMVTSETNQTKLASVQASGVTALMDKPFDLDYLKYLLSIHYQQPDTKPESLDLTALLPASEGMEMPYSDVDGC